ncbi:MAG: cell envelope integrity protein CreD [Paludibacter sp.]|jgi:inner membrane protein involved in colicin E2 resistance|nr:cell envelope integrity protein CreD [Paludibacter sp.]
MNDFMEDFMEKIEPLKFGKYTFLTSLAIGTYLFVGFILQLEDIALLIGSVGLFVILAVIMFFSRKIQWYKVGEESDENAL